MPKAYLIAHVRVHDNEGYEKFRAMAGPVVAEHGGKVLVRNSTADHREGSLRGRVILIEFESMDAARRFYESAAYTAARAVREKAAETDLLLVEGL